MEVYPIRKSSLELRYTQLAEAILSEDGADDRDASSIMLADTRTRHRSRPASPDEERQFLVAGPGDDEDEDEGEGLEAEVRSFRSSASMDGEEQEGDAHRLQQERRGDFMANSAARASHLQVHGADEPEWEGEEGKKAGGLAAKAGIILVSISYAGCGQRLMFFVRSGDTQRLHRHATVRHDGCRIDHLRDIRRHGTEELCGESGQ